MTEVSLNDGNLKSRAQKGGITVVVFLVIQTLTSIATQVTLARFMQPEAFGKLAMAMFIVMIYGFLINTQGDKYIIQTKENISEKINVIITYELLLAVALVIFVYLTTPLLMKLINREGLVFVVQWLALSYLVAPFQKIRTSLEKNIFMFKSKLASFIGQISGSILVVTLAIYGFGIYALIVWMIAIPLLDVLALVFISRFKVRFKFSGHILKEVYAFTLPIIGASVLIYFVGNVDYYIVGEFSGYTKLGYYWLAFQLSQYLLKVKTAINSVLLPAFAHPESKEEKCRMFDMAIRLTATVYVLPALIILILGKYFILLVYGEKWLPSLIPLKIFLVIVVVKAVSGNAGPLLYSLGKTRQDLKLAIINAITLPVFVVIGTYYYGIVGAAVGVMLSAGFSAFYGFAKYISPETGKSIFYYYHKSVLFLAAIWGVLLIKDNLFVVDNLYFDSVFIVVAGFAYILLFRTELLSILEMVIARTEGKKT